VVIDCVIIPILHTTANGPSQRCRDQVHSRFDEASREQTLLAPRVAAIAVANRIVLFGKIKRTARRRGREHVPRGCFELVERAHVSAIVDGAGKPIQFLAQVNPSADARASRLVRDAHVGHVELGRVGIAVDGKRRIEKIGIGEPGPETPRTGRLRVAAHLLDAGAVRPEG
jgi:hypothetical protein